MPRRAVIIGGGIGGMAAALLLADRGFAVRILEAGPRPGAGWRSAATEAGPADLGIRVPRESGNARADALVFHAGVFHAGVFHAGAACAWNRLGAEPSQGHVACGRLNHDTPCPDARILPPVVLARARAELLARAFDTDPAGAAPHLAARLGALFGPTLLDTLLRPACRALLGAEPEALAWNAAQARLPARLVVADGEETERLRQMGALGARLAHPRAAEAPRAADAPAYLYPREGGIGRWTTALDAALSAAGVEVRSGARVAALRHGARGVVAVRLDGGAELPADLLVLAAGPNALPFLPALPEVTLPAAARLLTVEGGTAPALHWLASYDPATPFLRLGFPDRLEGRRLPPGAPWRILAELPIAGGAAPGTRALADALAGLGVLPRGARIAADRPVGAGRFAVETVELAAAREAALAELRGIPNLAVLRSATGGHALVGDLVADAARLAEAAAPAMAA
ncbi:FAD-dependent oxidoreductase [Falsiroseomonas sp. CW058]|uniref:FAD-dependent oxidoreductase n=1 Tax=Falsiroseomonas sp. CW058 TaxID=3388664 RepID=UPI003D32343B